MKNKRTLLVALLAAGLLMAGCSVCPPLAVKPVTEAYIDPELEDEWDEDAPNWQHPDDYATAPPSDEPTPGVHYFDIDDGQSDDDWDEDAPNWRHAGEN